jgi:hypothetical protein
MPASSLEQTMLECWYEVQDMIHEVFGSFMAQLRGISHEAWKGQVRGGGGGGDWLVDDLIQMLAHMFGSISLSPRIKLYNYKVTFGNSKQVQHLRVRLYDIWKHPTQVASSSQVKLQVQFLAS